MSHVVRVRHNFETAHRLMHLPGKCQNLHGHSWWADITVEAPALAAGMVVEFGPYKQKLRAWIDENLDHGAMLGSDDPLVPILEGMKSKLYVFPQDWPTVENVAKLLSDVAEDILHELVRAPDAKVSQVFVQETHVNGAGWSCQ